MIFKFFLADKSNSPNNDMEYREENIYKKIFKNFPDTIITPKKSNEIAIWWEIVLQNCWGVFEISPTVEQPYWTYITSGLSNPFEENNLDDDVSWYWIELMIRTQSKSNWAVTLLWNLMWYIGKTWNIFDQNHRMPLNSSINGKESILDTVIFSFLEEFQEPFKLSSWWFNILSVFWISENEYLFAKENWSTKLLEIITKEYPNLVVNENRDELIK